MGVAFPCTMPNPDPRLTLARRLAGTCPSADTARMRMTRGEASDIDYRQRTLVSAKRTQPKAMRWTGGILIGLALLNEAVPPRTAPQFFIALLAFGAAQYGLGVWLARESVPPRLVQAVYCITILALFSGLLLMYTNRPVGWDFAYLAALLTAFGPLTFGWVPYILSCSAMLATAAWTLSATNTPHVEDWMISLIGGVVIGAFLLDERLRDLRQVADAEYAREQLVQSDTLTGLLNRRGLSARLETVWAGALRRDEAVNVAFVDIVGLKSANDSHGHDFGDRVIVEAARAIRESVRAEDLVARWGGDEFVVVAKGEVSSGSALQARIVATLKMRSAAFEGKWHGHVTVGTASGAPQSRSFDELLEQADQAMYAARQRQAANPSGSTSA